MKFKGRTPSAGAHGLKARASRDGQPRIGGRARLYAQRVLTVALVLCLLIAVLRGAIGNVAGWPNERALNVFQAAPQSNFVPRAGLQIVPVGFFATLVAGWVLLGAWTQELGARGLIWLWLWAMLGVVAWFGLAWARGWRRPSLLLCSLLGLQLLGAAYYLSSFAAPPRRLTSRFTIFDFHVHTTRSNGLMTPQQQINWHRARGYSGLAFTDSNLMMPEAQLDALRRANPDMMLLNGCEYHGRAHLIILGGTRSISARDLDVPSAIQAAKAQNALVIAAHPWWPAKYTPEQLLDMGADGLEAWNGIIRDDRLALLTRQRDVIGTTATDTFSKSGARDFTWTLLPRGMNKPDDVIRALRLRKTAAAFALSPQDTPQNWDANQRVLRGPLGPFVALGAAWRGLAAAQKWGALLNLVALLSFVVAWGLVPLATVLPSGPQRAVSFLRRRRLWWRIFGVALMIGAFLGSVFFAVLTMGDVLKSSAWQGLTPLHALLSWLGFDALFVYGRLLWRRTQ